MAPSATETVTAEPLTQRFRLNASATGPYKELSPVSYQETETKGGDGFEAAKVSRRMRYTSSTC